MGAEHVFLYDNGSVDNSTGVVKNLVDSGFVTVISWATFQLGLSPQRHAYAHALCNFGPQFRWMAFIDLDEFLYSMTDSTLTSALSRYEDVPCVHVPWLMFGFSGHVTPPSGLVIENYTQRAPFPPPPARKRLLRGKSIVQPAHVVGVEDVHSFRVLSDDGNLPRSNLKRAAYPASELRINHYYTRSRQEFEVKLARPFSPALRNLRKIQRRRQLLAALIEAETIRDEAI